MATTNPNPGRIPEPLWLFSQALLALAPGSRWGGIYADKPGYHNTRDRLLAMIADGSISRDYSVELAADKLGPGDKAAAVDWTFPDAQAGDPITILRFMTRIRAAYVTRDPRLSGWREALGQADTDYEAEGYDFVRWMTRTPDSSHRWHIHFSVLRGHVNNPAVYAGMLSILRGETLEEWETDVTPTELLNTRLGDSGPTVGVAIQSGYGYSKAAADRTATVLTEMAALRGELGARDAAEIARDRVTLAALEAMAAGGTTVDTAAVIAAVRDEAAALRSHYSASITSLQNDLAEGRTEIASLRARLASAAQAEADELTGEAPGGTPG